MLPVFTAASVYASSSAVKKGTTKIKSIVPKLTAVSAFNRPDSKYMPLTATENVEKPNPYKDKDWYKKLLEKPEEKKDYSIPSNIPDFNAFVSHYRPKEQRNFIVNQFRKVPQVFGQARHSLPWGLKQMVYAALAWGIDDKVYDNFERYVKSHNAPDALYTFEKYVAHSRWTHNYTGDKKVSSLGKLRHFNRASYLANQWSNIKHKFNSSSSPLTYGDGGRKRKGILDRVSKLVNAAVDFRIAVSNDDYDTENLKDRANYNWGSLISNTEFTNYLWNYVCDYDSATETHKKGRARAGTAIRDAVSSLLKAEFYHGEWHGLAFCDYRSEAYAERWKELVLENGLYCQFVLPVIFHLIRLREFIGFDVPYYTKPQQAVWRYRLGKNTAKAAVAAPAAVLAA